MKILTAICMTAAMLAGMGTPVRGAELTTNINPALLYYQAFLASPNSPASPNYSSADWDFLYASLSNSWRGQKLPERFGQMMSNYDGEFKLVREAAQQTAPCDWGIDWDAGSDTLLPQLARAKQVAVAARFRTAWDLQQGRQSDACRDVLDMLALARHISRQNALIGVLVEVAMESIAGESVAENFGRFTPESLQQLEDGLAAAPARGTVAEALAPDAARSYNRLKTFVLDLRKQHPGDDAAVMAGMRQVFFSSDGADRQLWEQIEAAGGGTSDGVVKLAEDVAPLYQRLSEILATPYPAYQNEMDRFDAELKRSTNPFVAMILPSWSKSRLKDFRSEMNLAMLHAAIEYKLHGPAGFQRVPDPFGSGPFTLQRFVYKGVDRGFQIKSALTGLVVPPVQIFIEKEGAPIHLDGPHVGEPME